MSNTKLRLARDIEVTITPDGVVGIEQGDYIDTDPDYLRSYVEMRAPEMRRLVEAWLLVLTTPEPTHDNRSMIERQNTRNE